MKPAPVPTFEMSQAKFLLQFLVVVVAPPDAIIQVLDLSSNQRTTQLSPHKKISNRMYQFCNTVVLGGRER
jgi:hypothetical protein